MRVLVTGAGGKTGSIVVRKLLEQGGDKFSVRALVRSTESEEKLRASLGDLVGSCFEVAQGDLTKPDTLEPVFKGIEAVVVCTSAVPQLDKLSLPGVILTKLLTLGFVSRRPAFWYAEGQSPESLDYVGQCTQIDMAKTAGVKHFVLVSSMAGTKPDHFLNGCMDNLVLWKRKAECYLMSSSVPYTIIHPGGLLPHAGPGQNTPALGGRRQLIASLDDGLLDDEQKRNVVPREDLAEVCVQCLLAPDEAKGRSFDLGSGPETEEAHSVNLKELLAPLENKNCSYSQADALFKPESRGERGA